MNVKSRVGFALVAIATTALTLSGCATTSSDAASAKCETATARLKAADDDLASAQSELTAVLGNELQAGTHYQTVAEAALAEAQTQQKAAKAAKNAACANDNTSTAGSSTDPSASPDQELIDALKQAVANSQSCSTYVTPALLGSDGTVLPASAGTSYLAPVATGYRVNSDAIDTGLTGSTPQALYQSLVDKICSRPFVGYSWGNILSGLSVGGGKTVADVVPEIGPTDVTQINPMVKVALASTADWSKYQVDASRVVAVLNIMNVVGVESLTSVKNLHLANRGLLDSENYPTVEVNPNQESLPALVLAWRDKGQPECKEHALLGANVADARPEVFPIPECVTSTPTPTPSHTTPPHHTTPPTTPPHTTPPPTTCPTCVTPEQATQPVPTPAPQPSTVPTTEPSAQATVPVNTESPSPAPSGGLNGGSTTQPGATASPTPIVPTSDPTNSVDPGGF